MQRRPPPRLARLWLLLVVATASVTGPACSSGERPDADARRDYRQALLKAENRQKQRAQKREETRTQDDKGGLIPSGQRVAGVELPRGLTLRLETKHEWYYETRLPAEALRAYFGPRLNTLEVVPGAGDTITYQNALPRDTPGAERVSVRIGPLPKKRGRNEVHIRLPRPFKAPNSEAEARLLFEESQRYAQ